MTDAASEHRDRSTDEAPAKPVGAAGAEEEGRARLRAFSPHVQRLTAEELRLRATGIEKARITVEQAADLIDAGCDPNDEAYAFIGIALMGLAVEWAAIDIAEARLRLARGDDQRLSPGPSSS